MYLISILLLAISTNIDNTMIAINIGIGRQRLSVFSNILIAFISALTTYIFSLLASFFTKYGQMANIVGSIFIIVLGIATLLSDSTNSKSSETEQYENYKFAKVLVLAVALSVNCLPVAFGVGLTGMPPIPCAVAVGLFSAVFMRIGNYIGLKIAHVIKTKILKYISGISMIVLGIMELYI